jgi:hypothetical protein
MSSINANSGITQLVIPLFLYYFHGPQLSPENRVLADRAIVHVVTARGLNNDHYSSSPSTPERTTFRSNASNANLSRATLLYGIVS